MATRYRGSPPELGLTSNLRNEIYIRQGQLGLETESAHRLRGQTTCRIDWDCSFSQTDVFSFLLVPAPHLRRVGKILSSVRAFCGSWIDRERSGFGLLQL